MMKEKCTLREELFDGYFIQCDIIPMGKDYTMAVYGGDTPHVGSVVMSTARPSLTGEGIGVTSSVLTGIAHKDDVVAKLFAEAAAKEAECTVVCSCGIHVDDITPDQIKIVQEKSGLLLKQTLEYIKG